MSLLDWFSSSGSSGGDGYVGLVPRLPSEMFWPVITLTLSALVVVGYAAIAIDWFFHSKLPRNPESAAALTRLRRICLFCAACCLAFYATDVPWLIWRLYDAALLALVFYTWSFAFRMPAFGRLTARLARVDELERSAERYREIAELLPHMVWTATGDGFVDFANQRWREYTGDNRTWLQAIHPDEHAAAQATWRSAVAARQPFTTEVRLLGSGGGTTGYRTFVVKATPLAHGDDILWLGACADIEDQKRLAQQKEMQARQKSFFLNALSHDLRAPLHNVLLNAHLLQMSARDRAGGGGGDGAAELESVNMIMENAVAAGDLVTRLLDFAKMGGEEHNAIEVFPLEPMLQQIVRRFAPGTEQKGLYLRYESASADNAPGGSAGPGAGADGRADEGRGAGLRAGEVRVRTDRQKLQRIVTNLIDNAIKYTRHGGITVEVAAVEAGFAIRVSDTGIGVPPENAPYLFDEFYQVNNHERDRSKGFGMGLAICKSLASHIGADVRLVHTGADGSCFEITLPGAVVSAVGADRGGRPVGAAGDRPDPQAAGLCRV